MIKIEPFREINPPKNGYWINKKNKQMYGGAYISPLLIPNLKRVEDGFKKAIKNKSFMKGLEEKLLTFIGVNTPILFSKELTDIAGGQKKVGRIFLKRTDLHHDSSHKPVNAYASVKLAKYLGYKRIYTETGAAQNSRAVAAACAKENMECIVFIGEKDFQRVYTYPLAILNFFCMTIFPYLFVLSFIVFYLTKYYNWHRFNFHFPTFLVEND